MFMVLLLAGCGSKPAVQEMALSPDDQAIDLQGSHIFLLSMKTDNRFKPEWPPEVWAIEIIDDSTGEKIEIAVQTMSKSALIKKAMGDTFTMDKGTSSWEGLISFHLPPGSYHLAAVRGGCIRGAGIAAAIASFDFPFNIPFQVGREQFVYLGRIEMINRERLTDDEIPSGDTTVTRIPQQQSGFGTGTFDVTVMDNFERDIPKFREQYPVLQGMEITRKIMPPWTKPL
jgi:hypothetical protein